MITKYLKKFYRHRKTALLKFLIFHAIVSLCLLFFYLKTYPLKNITTWKELFLYAIPHLKEQAKYNFSPYIVWGVLWGIIRSIIGVYRTLVIRYLTFRNRIENIYMGLDRPESKSRKRLIKQIHNTFLSADSCHYLGIAGWETLGAREHSEMYNIIKQNKNKEIIFYLLNPKTIARDPARQELTILQSRVEDLNTTKATAITEREYKSWINTTIEVINKLNTERKDRYKIKYCLYDEKPIWRCYLFPKKVFFAYYQLGVHGHHSTVYQVSNREDELNTLHYVFENILSRLRYKYPLC